MTAADALNSLVVPQCPPKASLGCGPRTVGVGRMPVETDDTVFEACGHCHRVSLLEEVKALEAWCTPGWLPVVPKGYVRRLPTSACAVPQRGPGSAAPGLRDQCSTAHAWYEAGEFRLSPCAYRGCFCPARHALPGGELLSDHAHVATAVETEVDMGLVLQHIRSLPGRPVQRAEVYREFASGLEMKNLGTGHPMLPGAEAREVASAQDGLRGRTGASSPSRELVGSGMGVEWQLPVQGRGNRVLHLTDSRVWLCVRPKGRAGSSRLRSGI